MLRRLEAGQQARRELPTVEGQIRALAERQAAVVRKITAELAPLRDKLLRLRQANELANDAERTLRGTLSADQRADLAELTEEARPLREQADRFAEDVAGKGPGTIGYAIRQLTEQVERSRDAIPRIPAAQKEHARRELANEEQRLARFVETLEERQTRLAQLRAELRELDDRREEIMHDALTNV